MTSCVGVHHLGLSVPDLGAWRQALATLLPARRLMHFKLSADDHESATMLGLAPQAAEVELVATSRLAFEIFQFAGTRPTSPAVCEAGIGHFCVQGPDMAGLVARMAAAGGSFHAPPTDLGGDILYAYPRDMFGQTVELESVPGGPAGADPWVAHVALVTPDLDRLISFYSALTGSKAHVGQRIGPWAKSDQVSGLVGAELQGAWLPAGAIQLEFWRYFAPRTQPRTPPPMEQGGYHHLAFEVADLGEAMAALEAVGARFPNPPIRRGGLSFVYTRDPDGNRVELLALEGDAERLSCRHFGAAA